MMALMMASRWLWLAVLCVGLFGSGWFAGYLHERNVFMQYKANVEAVAHAAEVKARETEARHEADKKEIEQDYKERLDSLQHRYADSLRQSRANNLPKSADATRRLNEATSHSDAYLVEQCAETTLQLIELQNWVRRTLR
jgi:hypothetical protein